MKKPALLLVFLLWIGLIGCRSDDERPTPTPFPTPLPQAALPGAPQLAGGIPTTLADLLANPEFFAGALVQVTGQFGLLPRLVCGEELRYPSPATWTLEDGEALVSAGGFDTPLRELFPEGLTLTVVGRWQQWRGPVGCGKQAMVREFYYLEVARLLSPEQLVRVTLTPGAPPADSPELSETGTPTAVSLPPEPPAGTAVFPPETTPTPTRFSPDDPGNLPPTPTATTTPTREGEKADEDDEAEESGENQATATPDLTPPSGMPSQPTPPGGNDDGNGGAPVLPLPGQPTITPSAQAIDRGRLIAFDARYDAWADGEVHHWRVDLRVGEPITISLIAEPGVNSALRLISPANQVIATQDSAPAGQVESLWANVTANGEYTIQMYASNNQPGSYYFSLWDETGLIQPMGNLSPGVAQSGRLEMDKIHVWFFWAEAGRFVTLQTVAPAPNSLALVLNDPNQSFLTFNQAAITNFRLTETGWYSVEVEELTRDVTSYQISLTLQ